MKLNARTGSLLGGLAICAVLAVYFLSNGAQSPRTLPSTTEQSRAASRPEAPQPRAVSQRPSPDLTQLPAHGSTTRPSTTPLAPLTRPNTPQAYWQELEQLERKDKQQALAYALLGEEWYPEQEGKLAEARSAKIVSLMASVGRMADARARTRDFIQKYPNSQYRPLVQGVTGIHPRPGAPGR